jgi:2-polyprenyl-3-methyl-5-hydroxy-6-metoxy-1,4-benzoquinol methylase
MPTILLPNRRTDLSEFMDDANCDLQMLQNTYRQFDTVNGLISGWRRVYTRHIRPRLYDGATILDIGCGGGDLMLRLARWTREDGFDVQITGLEPDKRAVGFLESLDLPANIRVLGQMTTDLVAKGEVFDVVVSNHVLHHLTDSELKVFLDDSRLLCSKVAVHNDIRRDDLAYLGFFPSYLFFRNSFIAPDGLMSVKRSFRADELQKASPEGWTVKRMPLFRNLLIWTP